MEELIAEHLDAYGPLAVFVLLMLSGVGVPVGEDIVTIPAGILVGQEKMSFWPTVVAAYLGVCGSDCLWFMVISRFGTRLLHKRWFKRIIHPRRLLEAKHQIEQRGAWVIVMARFIPASRTPVITMAGLLHLPFWKFAIATFSCVLITAPMQIGFGCLIALGIGSRDLAQTILLIVGGVMLIVAGVFGYRWYRQWRAHRGPRPRAKAKWLRRFRAVKVRRAHQRRVDEAMQQKQINEA